MTERKPLPPVAKGKPSANLVAYLESQKFDSPPVMPTDEEMMDY